MKRSRHSLSFIYAPGILSKGVCSAAFRRDTVCDVPPVQQCAVICDLLNEYSGGRETEESDIPVPDETNRLLADALQTLQGLHIHS